MSKVLAVMMAGLFAAGAYAQNPAGTTSEQAPVTNTKPQQRAESRVDARPQGQVKPQAGDQIRSAELNPGPTGKTATAAANRKNVRNQRHPNRTLNPQGGTPN
ncbi:MAG TPA: cell envelope biogenesis protein TolA [Variovorax sp.]